MEVMLKRNYEKFSFWLRRCIWNPLDTSRGSMTMSSEMKKFKMVNFQGVKSLSLNLKQIKTYNPAYKIVQEVIRPGSGTFLPFF